MDELELSGRPHISAKRAARENRYHSDYIGQLIRSGKVAGQKVGRAWYVDAESLAAYLTGDAQPPMPPTAAKPMQEAAQEPAVETPTAQPAKKNIEQEPAVARAEATQPIAAPAPLEPQPVARIERAVPISKQESFSAQAQDQFVAEPHGLRFVPEDEPLPAVRTMQDFSPAEDEPMPPRAAARRGAGALWALAVLGVCAFTTALGGSYLVAYQGVVAGEQASASLHLSLPQ